MNSHSGSFLPSHADNGNGGIPPKQTSSVPYLALNNGVQMPLLGFGTGTARATARHAKKELDQDLIKAILLAIKTGFYHLDGAQAYGNERELGEAIKQSGVPRERLFVTTKISGTQVQDTATAFSESLEKLQLDYVDQYLIHAPHFASSDAELQEKWAAMEEIYRSGRAKSIGVSNFLVPHLKTILATAKVVPAINQIEYHPYLQHPGLVEFHKEHQIATSAYAPLTAITKASPGPLDDMYAAYARKYGVTPGEIALRWCIDQGIVALTTSGREDRLKGYLSVAQFKLTPAEVERITEKGKAKNFRGFWNAKFAEDDFS